MSPTLSVTVCLGPNCSVLGGQELLGWCQDLCQAGLALSVETVLCTGHCAEAPVVLWQDRYVTDIVANTFRLLERREGGGFDSRFPTSEETPAGKTSASEIPVSEPANNGDDSAGDDLPF